MTSGLAGLEDAINKALGPAADIANAYVFFSVPIGSAQLPVLVIWLVAVSLAMTLGFWFINVRGLVQAIRIARGQFADAMSKGEVSQFGALSTALAGTLGLGSVAGVAVAISIGGAGAMVWMTLTGFFGMTVKLAECALAVKYRAIGPDGVVNGGPMHYIPVAFDRLRLKPIGLVFAIFFSVSTVLASTSVFQVNQSFVQVRAVTGLQSPLLFGVIFALAVALVIIGGMRGIARVCTRLVPLLIGAYFLSVVTILIVHAGAIPGVVSRALSEAFDFRAIIGGGFAALVVGVQRAAYAGESGLGSAPIAHAAAKTNEPISEGLVSLIEPFVTVVIVCNLTALAILTSGVAMPKGIGGIEIASAAFSTVSPWFAPLLAVLVALLAYKTVLGWSYYGERTFCWLFGEGRKRRNAFRIGYLTALAVAPTLTVGEAIRFLDAMMFAMSVPNTIALLLLAPELRRDLASYYSRIVRRLPTAAPPQEVAPA